MIDVFAENLIDFRAVARLRPLRNNKTGKPAGLASIYRYVLRGARAANGERVKLEVVRTPSGLRSSRRAVERFIRAQQPRHTTPRTAIFHTCQANRLRRSGAKSGGV
jgi:hypothetical protein